MADIIRQVKMEDLQACNQVESLGFPEEEAASLDSIRSRIAAYPESFFVFERDGRIVGHIMGAVIDKLYIEDEMFSDISLHNRDYPIQAIFSVCVHPDFRRQGIAAQLIRHMVDACITRGKEAITLTCKKEKLAYYAKFGFKDHGIAGSVNGGAVWYNMVLELHG